MTREGRARIAALALAVVVPLLAFGSVSVYIIASQHRQAIVRTIQQTAEAAMASVERGLSDHVGDAEVLAALVDADLNRGALFERQIVKVMQVRSGRWMNVVVATRDGQIYNHDSNLRGRPLPQARFAALDAQVMESGRTHVSGVRARNDRYPEPYFTIRVPIQPISGPVTHLLVVVVRAWEVSLAAKAAVPPEGWRVGVTDPDGMIVGRATATDPNDPLISLRSTLADDTPEGEVVPISTPDGQRLYAGTARSRLYDGWAANVGLPVAALDGPLAATRFSVAVGGLVAFSLAMALGVMLVRAYARVATTERLEASLKEKETLLREVYHRVKNNLQIVDSLVSMQASRLNDPQAKDALADLRRRVHALGLVHQQLMQSKDLATFDVRPFLDELCANLAVSSGADERGIRVAVEAEPLRADLDFAVPLGLLVTELVTNALKHGFPNGQAGGVLVSLLTEPSDTVILAVADDGTAGERNPVQTSGGVGLRIAKALVMQLEGRMDVVQDNGTRVMVTMPRPEAA